MSSSSSTSGPSNSDAASNSSSSSSSSTMYMCKLYSVLTKMCPKHSELAGKRKIASGKAHVSHKIGNIRKKNRQPSSELLERKIGNFWSRGKISTLHCETRT